MTRNMRIFSKFFVLFSLFLVVSLISCSTSKAKVESLVDDVEAYHRDLIFERYDIAAKRISGPGRVDWVNTLRSQGIRFAEIQIQETEDCTEPEKAVEGGETDDAKEEPTPCVRVRSFVQWYSNASPTLRTSQLTTTWNYDYDTKTWSIVEQTQK